MENQKLITWHPGQLGVQCYSVELDDIAMVIYILLSRWHCVSTRVVSYFNAHISCIVFYLCQNVGRMFRVHLRQLSVNGNSCRRRNQLSCPTSSSCIRKLRTLTAPFISRYVDIRIYCNTVLVVLR